MRYLEMRCANPPLYPSNPIEAGRAQQIHMFIELYLANATASLVPMAFFGAPVDSNVVEEGSLKIEQSLDAIWKVARFEPYIAGSRLSHADLVALVIFDLTVETLQRLEGSNPLTNREGFLTYRNHLLQRAPFRKTLEERDAMLARLCPQPAA